MSQYLQAAFQKFKLLEEEDFNLDASGIEDMKSFMDDGESIDFEDIIDPEAETEEDLEDSYIGKVILDCAVCHSKIYKNANEVNYNEDTEIANEGEECPFCYSVDGFTIVGQVEGHQVQPEDTKTTKYEHVLPLLGKIEDDEEVDGLLLLINNQMCNILCEIFSKE